MQKFSSHSMTPRLDLRPKLADENAPGIIQDGHGTRASLNASQELSARTWGKKKQFEL